MTHLSVEFTEGNYLVLHGRLDTNTVDILEKNLQSLRQDIIVDISDVDYINSAGLGLLLKTYQELNKSGYTLTILNPTAYIEELLKITGLDQLLEVNH